MREAVTRRGLEEISGEFCKAASDQTSCNSYTGRAGRLSFRHPANYTGVRDSRGRRGLGMTTPRGGSSADPKGVGGVTAWPGAVARWLFGGRARRDLSRGPTAPVARFRNVCLSREAGAGAGTIARNVGTRLDWKVYDHEILEAIAQRMERPTDEVRAFDELAPSVVQDWILPLREEHYAPQEAYLDHLAKLVEAIGRAGDSVVVGRGAGFLLAVERFDAPGAGRRALEGTRREAGGDGWGSRSARPDARRATSTAVGPTSSARCTGSTRPTRTTTTSCSTRTASALTVAAEILIHAIEAGRPPVKARIGGPPRSDHRRERGDPSRVETIRQKKPTPLPPGSPDFSRENNLLFLPD